MKFEQSAGVILLVLSLQACVGLRSELYREETRHGYQDACKLYKQGDYAPAGTGFEGVIAMDPDYAPAHAALGHLALIREDYPAALKHYRNAVAADPELEPDLQPFTTAARAHEERAPLREAGVSLDRLYPLIMADRQTEVETILENNIPLQLLAGDTMGITPGRLGEVQQKIAETVDPSIGSVTYRLFAGYLLFFGRTDDLLATALIGSAADETEGRDRQEALVVLGQLHERRGEADAAVDAYLAAVDDGLPVTDVAHHLARVYRVDIERILPTRQGAGEDARRDPMGIERRTYLPPARAVDIGSAAAPKKVPTAVRTGSPYTF